MSKIKLRKQFHLQQHKKNILRNKLLTCSQETTKQHWKRPTEPSVSWYSFVVWNINIARMVAFPRLMYKFNTLLPKITAAFIFSHQKNRQSEIHIRNVRISKTGKNNCVSKRIAASWRPNDLATWSECPPSQSCADTKAPRVRLMKASDPPDRTVAWGRAQESPEPLRAAAVFAHCSVILLNLAGVYAVLTHCSVLSYWN